jgi:hypothetical protein
MLRGIAMIARCHGPMHGKRNLRRACGSLHGLARAGAAHGSERKQANEKETAQESHAKRDGEWAR